MKKDKEWFKKEIGKNVLSSWFDKLTLDMNIVELEFLIDELDEPETDYTMSELVKANNMLYERIDNLVNKLNYEVKQTDTNADSVISVIPQFVADYIEKWKYEGLIMHEWFTFDHDDQDEEKVSKWLYNNDNQTNKRREFMLIDAIRYGYEVEK